MKSKKISIYLIPQGTVAYSALGIFTKHKQLVEQSPYILEYKADLLPSAADGSSMIVVTHIGKDEAAWRSYAMTTATGHSRILENNIRNTGIVPVAPMTLLAQDGINTITYHV